MKELPHVDFALLSTLDNKKNEACFGKGEKPAGVRDPLFVRNGVYEERAACRRLIGASDQRHAAPRD